jgi:2-amino-4-hydroxy-6-hydroxymethyldihydropteridine diphosphokinase
MSKVFIGIGSNINPSKNVLSALQALKVAVELRGVSTVYSTAPERRPEQPRYYNCVAVVETKLPPLQLKRLVLRRIEASLGRKREHDRYAARTIDLDILLYGDLTVRANGCEIPDPQLFRRPYYALPVAELEPGLLVPFANKTIAELSGKFSTKGMRALKKYSRGIRRKLGLKSTSGKPGRKVIA